MSAAESQQNLRIILHQLHANCGNAIKKTTLLTSDTGMLLRSFLSFILDTHTAIVGLLSLETPFTL